MNNGNTFQSDPPPPEGGYIRQDLDRVNIRDVCAIGARHHPAHPGPGHEYTGVDI